MTSGTHMVWNCVDHCPLSVSSCGVIYLLCETGGPFACVFDMPARTSASTGQCHQGTYPPQSVASVPPRISASDLRLCAAAATTAARDGLWTASVLLLAATSSSRADILSCRWLSFASKSDLVKAVGAPPAAGGGDSLPSKDDPRQAAEAGRGPPWACWPWARGRTLARRRWSVGAPSAGLLLLLL